MFSAAGFAIESDGVALVYGSFRPSTQQLAESVSIFVAKPTLVD